MSKIIFLFIASLSIITIRSNNCDDYIKRYSEFTGPCDTLYHKSDKGEYYQITKDRKQFMLLIAEEEVDIEDETKTGVLLNLESNTSLEDGYFYYLFRLDQFEPLNRFFAYKASVDIYRLYANVITAVDKIKKSGKTPMNIRADTIFIDPLSLEVRFLEFHSFSDHIHERTKWFSKEYNELKGFYGYLTHTTFPLFVGNPTPHQKLEFINESNSLDAYLNDMIFISYNIQRLEARVNVFRDFLTGTFLKGGDARVIFKVKSSISVIFKPEDADENDEDHIDSNTGTLTAIIALILIILLVIAISLMSSKTNNVTDEDFKRRVIKKPFATIVYE